MGQLSSAFGAKVKIMILGRLQCCEQQHCPINILNLEFHVLQVQYKLFNIKMLKNFIELLSFLQGDQLFCSISFRNNELCVGVDLSRTLQSIT